MAIDRDPMHLHPLMREAVAKVLEQCKAKGLPFGMFEGYRTRARQADLFAQGRTKPGNKVTYAKPGESYHQYGCAADIVLLPFGPGSWAGKRRDWLEMHRIGAAAGLEALDWELPHLQMAGLRIRELQAGKYPPGGDASWLAIVGK